MEGPVSKVLSFQERFRLAKSNAKKGGLNRIKINKRPTPVNVIVRELKDSPVHGKRPAARILVKPDSQKSWRDNMIAERSNKLSADHKALVARAAEKKQKQKAIEKERLAEAKVENKKLKKLPEYEVGEADPTGKISVKILDGQNTTIIVKPGADIEAVVRKICIRPENDIKPLVTTYPKL